MADPDEFTRDSIRLQIARSLRRARYHRAEGNEAEAEAAETSMNGWIEQYGRIGKHRADQALAAVIKTPAV